MSSTTGMSPGGQGGNIQPTQRELEATAWAEVTKKFWLAILPADSLEVIPFTQQTYQQKFHYDASASKPTLTVLEQLRVSVDSETLSSEGWTAVYDDFLKQLAQQFPNLSKRLQELSTIPYDKRDGELVAFNNALILVAKGVTWMDSTTKQVETASAAALYQMYLALPYIALRGSINIGEGVIMNVENLLSSLGPNYPFYDVANNTIREMKDLIIRLNTLRVQLESEHPADNVGAKLQELASNMNTIKERVAHSGLGNQIQILNSMLQALTTVTSSLALNWGSPSLVVSLDLASIGLNSSESDAGIIGNQNQRLLASVLSSAITVIDTGPTAEIKDLEELRQDLENLKNGK